VTVFARYKYSYLLTYLLYLDRVNLDITNSCNLQHGKNWLRDEKLAPKRAGSG